MVGLFFMSVAFGLVLIGIGAGKFVFPLTVIFFFFAARALHLSR